MELQNLVDETLSLNKQMIIFVNSKRGAESTAEKISKKLKITTPDLI